MSVISTISTASAFMSLRRAGAGSVIEGHYNSWPPNHKPPYLGLD